MKALVSYYSQSGNTAALAHQIAERLGGAEERIVEEGGRTGNWGTVTGAIGAALGQASDVAQPQNDPSRYDLVAIGTPIWSGAAAPAVNAYIDAYRDACDKVALFCTEGALGDGMAFSRMQRRLGRAPVACLALTEAELRNGEADARLDHFIAEIEDAAS